LKFLSASVGVLFALLSVPAVAGGSLRVVDLTDEFDRFVMATAEMPDAQRVVAFERQLGPIANGFYSRERAPEGYDFRVLTQLKTYPQRRTANLAVSRQFREQFAPARDRFEAVFGPVPAQQPAFLLDSMGEFDGGTRELNGKLTLLFGADVIAKFHSDHDMTPFFHHELVHAYREPRLAKCAEIWCALWEEGLATYIASRLSPGADDDALSLTVPEPIRPAVEANRAGAICTVVRRLDSNSPNDFANLFMRDSNLDGYPARMGYYIGYRVAAEVGRTHSLQALADMSPDEARPLIDAALARMATCGARTVEARERSRTDRSGG
jgi:hypothetical protein